MFFVFLGARFEAHAAGGEQRQRHGPPPDHRAAALLFFSALGPGFFGARVLGKKNLRRSQLAPLFFLAEVLWRSLSSGEKRAEVTGARRKFPAFFAGKFGHGPCPVFLVFWGEMGYTPIFFNQKSETHTHTKKRPRMDQSRCG